MAKNGALVINFQNSDYIYDFLEALHAQNPAADRNGLTNPLVMERAADDEGAQEWRRLVDGPGLGTPSLGSIMTTYEPSKILLFLPDFADPNYKPEAKQAAAEELRARLKTAPDTQIIVCQPEFALRPEVRTATQTAIDEFAKQVGVKTPIIWEKSSNFSDMAKHVAASIPGPSRTD